MPAMMEADMNYIALGVLIEAYLLSLIYGKWAQMNYNLQSRFKFGGFTRYFCRTRYQYGDARHHGITIHSGHFGRCGMERSLLRYRS